MNGFDVYKIYVPVKTHFTNRKYNIFQHNGRLKGQTYENYLKRDDYLLFEKIGNRFSKISDVVQFFVANFANGKYDVIYSNESYEIYQKWIGQKESLSRVFENDISTIMSAVNSLENSFVINDSEPILLKLLLQSKISIQTTSILCNEFDIISKYDWVKILFWQDKILTIEKLIPFIKYDKTRITNIINDYK